MIVDKLASVITETAQIRAPAVQNRRSFLLRQGHFAVEIGRVPVPLWILVNGLSVKGVREFVLDVPEDPGTPTKWVSLRARFITRIDLFAGNGIFRTAVNLLQSVKLWLSEALRRNCSMAKQNGWI